MAVPPWGMACLAYSVRLRLMRELGVICLDERGMLIDRPLLAAIRATPEELPLPPPVEALQEGPPAP